MNISKNWLNEYVALDCDVPALCDKLTAAGIEVEAIESAGGVPDGVVVAKIVERAAHPNSDHLSVCKVFDGRNVVQVVCGAPNCDAGKTVPLACVGTVFKSDEGEFKIKPSKLRGVESFGMMCAPDELGLPGGHDGLMILDDALEAGTPMTKLYPGDCRIEIEVTPNRPDWLSHWGVARDVSCLLNAEAHLPEVKLPAVEKAEENSRLVTVEAPELCPRYIGRLIRNVKIAESPAWLKERLESVGLRPINNVVDVTNFVMFELGQPLHAFDLAKLSGGRVVVRRAKSGEELTTLDGKKLKLENRHLVIADAEKPMALAGVMGGEASGVTETTTDVLLESAIFFSSNIRSTSRELGISSDASYRYERGADFDMANFASDRAAQLILAVAGGYLATEKCEVSTGRPAEKVIRCRFDRVRSLIGTEVSNERMVDIFRKLHLHIDEVNAEDCVVRAPLFRLDLEREADLAEEVARINGLAAIPEIAVQGKLCASIAKDTHLPYQTLRDHLIDLGLYECMHYSMVNEKSALSDSRFEKKDLIELANPLSLELAYMRPGLLGEMLNTVERNISRRNLNLRLFEVGKVFCKNAEQFPEERFELCIALSGLRMPERFSDERKMEYDFYDLKGALEGLFELCRIKNYRFQLPQSEDKRFAKGAFAEVWIQGKLAGHFGRLNRVLCGSWRTTHPVFVAQLEVAALFAAIHPAAYYAPFSLFPAVSRDVAFVAPENLTHAEILDFIRKCKLPDLESAELFDVFVDDKLREQKRKSMAYGLSFRNPERTLTDNEVNARFEKLRTQLAEKLKVELR